MKVKFLATGNAPTHYSFDGETVTAHYVSDEAFNLSSLGEGDRFDGVEVEALALPAQQVIREAERVDGELYVTLCQRVGPGNWTESDWIDAIEYDPDKVYAVFKGKAAGQPFAVTRRGKEYV